MRNPKQIYGLPMASLDVSSDITMLFQRISNWRTQALIEHEADHYKTIARDLGFTTEHRLPEIGRKGVDLFETYQVMVRNTAGSATVSSHLTAQSVTPWFSS